MNKKNDEKRNENMTENTEAVEISPEVKQEEQIADSTVSKTISQSTEDIQGIKEKLSNLENQYIRLMADYQNLQKRASQEKEELYKYAAQKTLEVLLPALDTFDYARASVKPDSKAEKIIEDFTLVFEMLLKCLKDIGLETIEETGIPFNPFHHEPLHQIPTNELPEQTVVQVLKKGYMLNKKVIRPALVSVSIKEEMKG
ncbi:MAG: nucleotide exchange factor GrpE [Candidatus Melainabacteria bacterium RIFCSPLOWO2_02_FULL_35_15]|nr:MAG: nucleotide exchange factor GrpE [Candidatus Melainabacteria bacterium RIFCSPLOWO2_12_FULL_35_11]OGI13730.1 MAG: nucleotide exchange factor GrpE [Candidatus Melainabacteria bacterium RIFCSPLOWO2_02_FULL_35_15]